MTERGIAYGTRVLGRRSFRSSRGSHAPPGRTGEPSTGRRETGGRAVQRERVRDARIPEPSGCSSTGELIDAETVTISSERGGWKSACQSNSLAAYSTLTSSLEGADGKGMQPAVFGPRDRHQPFPRQPPTLPQARFGGGRMEKDATGYLSLLSHDRLTKSGTRRTSPAAYPTIMFHTRAGPERQERPVEKGVKRF